MARALDALVEKLHEADLFLEHMKGAGFNLFAFTCYFNAFLSATRSVTFVMQAEMKSLPGFKEWYATAQAELVGDPLARFFVERRNASQKAGDHGITSGSSSLTATGQQAVVHYFDVALTSTLSDEDKRSDVVTLSERYLRGLILVVHKALGDFQATLDPQHFLRPEPLAKKGLTVEDVEEGLGLPRGWTAVSDLSEADRLRLLQRSYPPMLEVSDLLEKYGFL